MATLLARISPGPNGSRLARCKRCDAVGEGLHESGHGYAHNSPARLKARDLDALAMFCACPGGPHTFAADPTPEGVRVYADHCGRRVPAFVAGRRVGTLAGPLAKHLPVIVAAESADALEAAHEFADRLAGFGYKTVRYGREGAT